MGMIVQPFRFIAGPPPVGDDHRYWRIFAFGGSGGVASISRLEFRETPGGPDVAPGNTVITSGSWTDPANVFDGNNATFGYTSAPPSRAGTYAIGINFGASSANWPSINQIAIRNRSDDAAQGVTGMIVQYSDDNVTWTDAWQISSADWSVAGTTRTFTRPDPAVYASYNVVVPPTDTGPNAIVLTANGNANTSGGRFNFDGDSDYYSNVAIPVDMYGIPWKFTLEIDDVLADNTGFKGIINIGDASSRFLLITNNGSLELWEDSTNRITVGSVLNNVTPVDIKMQIEGPVSRMYANGVLVGSGAFASTNLPNDLYLGADPASFSGRSLSGSFAGVRFTRGLV